MGVSIVIKNSDSDTKRCMPFSMSLSLLRYNVAKKVKADKTETN